MDKKTPISLLAICQRACRRALSRLKRVKRFREGFLISYLSSSGENRSVYVPQWNMGFQTILSVVLGSSNYSWSPMVLPPYLLPVYRGGEEHKYVEYCLPVVAEPVHHSCVRCLESSKLLSTAMYGDIFYSSWPRIPNSSKMIDHLERDHNSVLFKSYHSNFSFNLSEASGDVNRLIFQAAASAKEQAVSLAQGGFKGLYCRLVVDSCGGNDCPFNHPHGYERHYPKGRPGVCTLSLPIQFSVPTLGKDVFFDSLRKLNCLRPRRHYGEVLVTESDILKNLSARFSKKLWDFNFSLLGSKKSVYIPSRRSRRRARARLLRS